MTFVPDRKLTAEHRQWLMAFDPQHLANWEKLLASDPEAAMCEAAVRPVLAANGVEVEPGEDLTGQRMMPDFRCRRGADSFLVEVTCLHMEKVTEVTGLPRLPDLGDGSYAPLNDAIYNACRQKTPQCADQSDPCLVAVGTFQFNASQLCVEKFHLRDLLTGERQITRDFDPVTHEPVGETYEMTQLRSATFARPGNRQPLESARDPVSGMLIFGFGCEPPNVYGILHQSPVREFDRSLLPKISFCRLKDGYEEGEISTEWI